MTNLTDGGNSASLLEEPMVDEHIPCCIYPCLQHPDTEDCQNHDRHPQGRKENLAGKHVRREGCSSKRRRSMNRRRRLRKRRSEVRVRG